MSEFLAMGGHGLYVWLAYGATVAIVLANVVSVWFSRKRYLREAMALARRQETAQAAGSQRTFAAATGSDTCQLRK